MSEGRGSPPGGQPPGAGKRPALGLQIKLPCATLADVKARYGADLKQNRFSIRTKTARPKDTPVRLEAMLSSGAPAFRAAAVIVDSGELLQLQLVGVDETARDLIASLGGKPPALLRLDPSRPPSAPIRPGSAGSPSRPPTGAIQPSSAGAASRPPTGPIQRPPAGPGHSRPAPMGKPAEPLRPAALPKAPAIGIDLGTTNSVAAAVRDGKPFVIPSPEGYNLIPSIVALSEKGKLIVGHPAKSQLLINPHNTVFGAKRLVGRQFSSPVVSDLVHRFPYRIVEGQRGEAAVQLGDRQLSLQEISAMVLREVKEMAQRTLRAEVERAVITVPAYYNDNQRNAVREAGELAGLKVERILNEPTAAALAFAHGRHLDQRVMVYDLGGGTFDASILELHGNFYEVVSTGGDTFLGGVDFDKVIVDHLLAAFKEQNGFDFPGQRVEMQRITDAAERAKIALSEQMEVQVKVPFVALVNEKPYDLDVQLTRAELVVLTGHLLDRTLKVCSEVLRAKGLEPKDIAEVLLVGGQSRMPLVRERIRAFFGKEPSKAVHADEAVALGAALLAHSLDSDEIEGVVLVDVLPMSIGVGVPGGRFRRVIERNTSLPHKKSITVTARGDEETLEVAVFQGESETALENEYLGTLMVSPLPPAPPGPRPIDVLFSLSPESLLNIVAREPGASEPLPSMFSTRDTPEEIRQRLGAAAPGASRPAAQSPNGAGSGLLGWIRRIFTKPGEKQL